MTLKLQKMTFQKCIIYSINSIYYYKMSEILNYIIITASLMFCNLNDRRLSMSTLLKASDNQPHASPI